MPYIVTSSLATNESFHTCANLPRRELAGLCPYCSYRTLAKGATLEALRLPLRLSSFICLVHLVLSLYLERDMF